MKTRQYFFASRISAMNAACVALTKNPRLKIAVIKIQNGYNVFLTEKE